MSYCFLNYCYLITPLIMYCLLFDAFFAVYIKSI